MPDEIQKIRELHRFFVKTRSFKFMKATGVVFIGCGSKYPAHTMVAAFEGGRWTCNNPRVGRFEYFNANLKERGKLGILRALEVLKVVSRAEVQAHGKGGIRGSRTSGRFATSAAGG